MSAYSSFKLGKLPKEEGIGPVSPLFSRCLQKRDYYHQGERDHKMLICTTKQTALTEFLDSQDYSCQG